MRNVSACWASREVKAYLPIFVTPSTRCATSGPNSSDEAFLREGRVLEDVVEKPGGDRGLVELHLREDHRDVERVDEVRLARGAELVAVLVRRDDVRPAQQVLVQARVVGLDFLEDVLEAQHGPIIGAPGLSG